MKRLTAALFAALAAASCDRNPTSPQPPDRAGLFPQTTAQDVLLASRSRLAAEEKTAYDRVLAHFRTDESKEYIRRQLAVPGRRIELQDDKVARGLLDAYYKKRAESGQASQLSVVPATLALVDKLPAQEAAAVIVRRTGAEDAILLPEEGASVEALGSAITALYAIRAREGDVTSRNTRFTVENAVMPRHWKGGLAKTAAKTLSDLKREAKKNVGGIGDARATQILLVGS